MTQLTVSQLAKRVGSTPSALRYYERIGLLPEPARSAGGYRLYGKEAEERVRFIKRAQRFGLRLEEISELLDIRERGLCPCGHTRELLTGRLAELDEEITGLTHLRSDIERMVSELPVDPDGEGWQCAGGLVALTHRPGGSEEDRQEDRQEEGEN